MIYSLGSPYAKHSPTNSFGSAVKSIKLSVWLVHALLYLAILKLSVEDSGLQSGPTGDREENVWVAVAILVTQLWLLFGPILIVRWQGAWNEFAAYLDASKEQEDLEIHRLNSSLEVLTRFRGVIYGLPVVSITLAFLAGDAFVKETLGLSTGIQQIIWLVALCSGALVAGRGLFFAAVTLVAARTLSRQRGDFTPFAGVTSTSTHQLSRFCFTGAMIFGIGGSLILPGFCVAAFVTEGPARGVLIALIVLVVLTTIFLLALPAYAISQQVDDERRTYLNALSEEIEVLANQIVQGSAAVDASKTARLNSLLELRAHVVQHMVSHSSVQLVRRIPITVIIPLSTVLTAWLGLISGN